MTTRYPFFLSVLLGLASAWPGHAAVLAGASTITDDQPAVWQSYQFTSFAVFNDDAGDRNFVVEAMMTLLGRRPKSADELEALTDLTAEVGREAVVRLLMEEDDFLLHWTDVLFRLLGVQQTGTRFQLAGCFGQPLRVHPDGSPMRDGGALAAAILDTEASTPVNLAVAQRGARNVFHAPGFNAVDVAISGLQHGSVWPMLKVISLSLVQRTGEFNPNDEANREARREHIGRAYMGTLLHRNPDCIQCHQSNASESDAKSGWNRHYPVPVDLEKALLGDDNFVSSAALPRIFAAFRKDVALLMDDPTRDATINAPSPFGFRPWGLSPACGTYETAATYGAIEGAHLAGEQGVPEGYVSSWDLQRLLHESIQLFPDFGLLTAAPAPGAAVPMPLIHGDSIAYLMALNLVDRIWEEVYGTRLTLDHGFPRNAAQRDYLRYLTEQVFLPSGGSVKAVLLAMLTGDLAVHFNRTAPKTSYLSTAVSLPPIYDPWLATGECPESPGCTNTKAHQVHRYAVRTQLRAASSALGWPAPERQFLKNFELDEASADDEAYPGLTLLRDLDDKLSDEHPGSPAIGFQSLLEFEHRFGACEPMGPDQGPDWIDQLLAAIDAQPETATSPLTLEEVILIMKDRLVGQPYFDQIDPPLPEPMWALEPSNPVEPTAQIEIPGSQKIQLPLEPALGSTAELVDPSTVPKMITGAETDAEVALAVAPTPNEERALLRDYFFSAPLSTDAKALKQWRGADFDARIRGYCGILLKSPQAMLANLGLARVDRVHPVKVCNPGEPCSYGAWCEHYLDRLGAIQTVDLQCHARSLGTAFAEGS